MEGLGVCPLCSGFKVVRIDDEEGVWDGLTVLALRIRGAWIEDWRKAGKSEMWKPTGGLKRNEGSSGLGSVEAILCFFFGVVFS